MEITFITGNKDKWNIANGILSEYNILLNQQKISTPEIQSIDVKEIALYSAEFACNKLNIPVIKTDVGYYIKSLNGFPGPFMKYINNWFEPDNLLDLMKNIKNRKVEITECIAYCAPKEKPRIFIHTTFGKIATKAQGKGNTIDKLLIHEGFDYPQGTYSYKIILEYWKKDLTHFHDLGTFLTKKDNV